MESRKRKAVDVSKTGTSLAGETQAKKLPKKESSVKIFYSKSKDQKDLEGYDNSDWRRRLSNFSPRTLTIRGRCYPSAEHAFQAAKAKCSTIPKLSKQFEVGGKINEQPGSAKKAGGKGSYKKAGVELDVVKWNRERDHAMEAIVRARFDEDEDFRKILQIVSRNGAYLLHFERSGAKSYWGGSVAKDTGRVQGNNALGELMMRVEREHRSASKTDLSP
uniref:NADAR domain-containing protein n=1 Tax=Odontella aurita TaxID=265563 RepID=A0A7S4K919_9STRA|mmetsp:Transcript_7183/g.21363  ORF Transcript_7183/g.21363 Transcript_7183/m.21363 type:complete len:219 (+) Transcript_7183:202-858(+)